MSPVIKNIFIFVLIGGILFFIYFFVFQGGGDDASLVTDTALPVSVDGTPVMAADPIAQDFLSLLLSVKSIRLDDSIFTDQAFNSLKDSSITLTQDVLEGRPNPFAPIGTDPLTPPPQVVIPSPAANTGSTSGSSSSTSSSGATTNPPSSNETEVPPPVAPNPNPAPTPPPSAPVPRPQISL